jgi:hypothetical protein
VGFARNRGWVWGCSGTRVGGALERSGSLLLASWDGMVLTSLVVRQLEKTLAATTVRVEL